MLNSGDREVLWLYALTRLGLWITAYCVRWLFAGNSEAQDPSAVLAPWQQWDWWHYVRIARDGYFPGRAGPGNPDWDNREAFFPGFPLTLRATHVVVPNWAFAGLLISLLSGAVAVLALARIAQRCSPCEGVGSRVVFLFLLSPCAVFLAAGYTEALFLALALPAWLAGMRRDWPLAAVLTTLSTTVRISGLFLAASLLVRFLLTQRRQHEWSSLPWLAAPSACWRLQLVSA